MRRNFRSRKNSGQTLVITALVISLLILSVFYSVFEAGRKSETRSATTLNDYVIATKLGLDNTVTSSLVNVTKGGANEILESNLNKYVSFVGNQSYFGKCTILFDVSDTAPYLSGLWLSWGSDGTGISSAHANYTLTVTMSESDIQLEHETNITTRFDADGTYSLLADTLKQVNVTCNILNEDLAALANNITLYYDYDGSLGTQDWTPADSPETTDYGNGTYTISFIATTHTRNDPVIVSAQVYDQRNIFVLANNTCTET